MKVDTAFPKSYRRTARVVYASTTRRDACQREAAYERVNQAWPGTEDIEHQTRAEIGRPRSGRRRRRRLGEQLSWAAAAINRVQKVQAGRGYYWPGETKAKAKARGRGCGSSPTRDWTRELALHLTWTAMRWWAAVTSNSSSAGEGVDYLVGVEISRNTGN